jgi:hypothetical protein
MPGSKIKTELDIIDTNGIIKEINEHRSKVLEEYTKAWLAAVAPKAFDIGWIMKNIVLCHRTIYEEGKMIDQTWIELVKPK